MCVSPDRGRWPITTVSLLTVMVLVFGIEVHFAAPGEGTTLSPLTQLLLGGLSATLTQAGQWSRLLSYAFLHASVEHLVLNAMVLALAGPVLERIVGHAWVFCIFAMGAACGGLASVLTLSPSTVTVGASGGIMALLGALFMTSFRLPAGRARAGARARAIVFGLPGVIPHHAPGPVQVNYGAHVGGAILGITVGVLLHKGWDARSTRPPCRAGAALLSAVAILGFGCSAYAASVGYRLYGPASRFIPPALFPTRPADIAAHGNALAASYPMDARAHVLAGNADLTHRQVRGAEYEFTRALDLDAAAPGLYPRDLTNNVHLALALLLFADGRRGDAIVMARPFCRQPGQTVPAPRLIARVSEDRLCD